MAAFIGQRVTGFRDANVRKRQAASIWNDHLTAQMRSQRCLARRRHTRGSLAGTNHQGRSRPAD